MSGNYRAAREAAEEAANKHSHDKLFRGWLLQLAAQAAFYEHAATWDTAGDLQQEAHSANPALLLPPGHEAVFPLTPIRAQATRVAAVVEYYEQREGYLASLERGTMALTGSAPAKAFEAGLRTLGEYLGFSSERLDFGNGGGPDNIWRTDDGRVFVLSCKNEKKLESPLHKKDLSQLFIDAKWIESNQPELTQILVVVHPSHSSDESLPVEGVNALTLDRLSALVSATKVMAGELSRQRLVASERELSARGLLKKYELTPDAIVSTYLTKFIPLKKGTRQA